MLFDHHNHYDQLWKKIDTQSNIKDRWRSRYYFAFNEIKNQSKVIDIACGDGILGGLLTKEKKCQVHGLDISEFALSIAESHGLKVNRCDISNDIFPYPDKIFDYAVLTCTLEHIINPISVLAEAERVLKPKGIVLITLPNIVYLQTRLAFLRGRTPKDFVQTTDECMHFHFFNYSDEFETRILSRFNRLRILKKFGDIKNPHLHSKMVCVLWKLLINLWPNLFAQYTNWVLIKE